MSSEVSTKAKLTKEQYEMLLYCEQYYWMHGSLPTYKQIEADGIDYPESEFHENLANPKFVASLRGRGLPDHLFVRESQRNGFRVRLLTEQQISVANAMVDVLDKRSRLKKLTEFGISTSEYNTWLRDPLYRSYCLARAEELLESNQHVAHLSLIERVSQGDLGAIKYFNSMTGRYREKADSAVQINLNSTNNYGEDKLIAVVEIIQRHVKDPDTLAAIGADILALRGGSPVTPVGAQKIIQAEIEGITA